VTPSNFFLSALTPDDAAALSAGMLEVNLRPGEVLFEVDDEVDAIYFPQGACISIARISRNGTVVETSMIGRESGSGLLDAVTGRQTRSRVFVQVGGRATKISARLFRDRLVQSADLTLLAFQHVRAIAEQSEQGVACNTVHSVHSRLARYLLMTQDRVGSPAFSLTQEHMAVMTGVQRSTVSITAGALKKAGMIDYRRGKVTIQDRPGLEKQACECYAVVRRDLDLLRADGSAGSI